MISTEKLSNYSVVSVNTKQPFHLMVAYDTYDSRWYALYVWVEGKGIAYMLDMNLDDVFSLECANFATQEKTLDMVEMIAKATNGLEVFGVGTQAEDTLQTDNTIVPLKTYFSYYGNDRETVRQSRLFNQNHIELEDVKPGTVIKETYSDGENIYIAYEDGSYTELFHEDTEGIKETEFLLRSFGCSIVTSYNTVHTYLYWLPPKTGLTNSGKETEMCKFLLRNGIIKEEFVLLCNLMCQNHYVSTWIDGIVKFESKQPTDFRVDLCN